MLLSLTSHLNSVRAILPTAVLLGVSPTYFLVHTSWRVISIFLGKRTFHVIEDALWGWYQKMVVFAFESCTGVEVVIHGDVCKRTENAVLICNHQTAMDWIVTDFLALRQGMIGHMRFVFKDILKYFPLYGYVWGVHGGVFVRRDGTYNAKKMKQTLTSLKDSKVPLYLVIYPEGTRFCPGKEALLAKSQAYARENELEPLDEVLTPRVKAFKCSLSALNGYLDAVYDTTIIYENKGEGPGRARHAAPSMWDVLSGKCQRILIHFERIPAREIPYSQTSDVATFKWLHMRFRMKDDILKSYYAKSDATLFQNHVENRSTVPVSSSVGQTLVSSFSLTLLTGLLLCTPFGRQVYMATVFGGTFFCWGYAYMFL